MNVTQEQLENRNAFQKVLIDLATKFINQPIDQMDEAIIGALRQLGEFLGASISSINQLVPDHSRYIQRYRWRANSNVFPTEVSVPVDDLFNATLLSYKILEIADVNTLPEQSSVRK